MNLKTPYFISGYDKTQFDRPIFKKGDDIKFILENKLQYFGPMPNIVSNIFGDKFKNFIYDFNYETIKDEIFPTEIFPLTFLKYNYRNEVNKLEAEDIIQKEDVSTLKTNCSAHHFFSYLSYKHYNCHVYETTFASGVRLGESTTADNFGIQSKNLTREELVTFLEIYKCILFDVSKKIGNNTEKYFSKYPEMI